MIFKYFVSEFFDASLLRDVFFKSLVKLARAETWLYSPFKGKDGKVIADLNEHSCSGQGVNNG